MKQLTAALFVLLLLLAACGRSTPPLAAASATGQLLQELRPCQDPGAGITFAHNRAFIACSERGFAGKVIVVNLDTFAIETTIELRLPSEPLFLITSAANERAVVVTGQTTGPEETSYSVITVIDPRTLAVQAQLRPGKTLTSGESSLLKDASTCSMSRAGASRALRPTTAGAGPRGFADADIPGARTGATVGHDCGWRSVHIP